jgi:hypothetical protein
MNGSLSDQAERFRAAGGPWNREVEANFLNNSVTVLQNEMIDMSCSFRNTVPCTFEAMAGFRRAPLHMTKVP